MEIKKTYLKIIGERYGFEIANEYTTNNGWVEFNRLKKDGSTVQMTAPFSSVAFIEVIEATLPVKDNVGGDI